MKCLIIILLFIRYGGNFVMSLNDSQIDPSKTIVWGPGILPDKIRMGARYVFLQLVNTQQKNLTVSPGKGVVTAQIQGQSWDKHLCHIWTQILDCKDGSFIIRYKLYNTCFNMKLDIKVNGESLPISLLQFRGPVYEEECYCPNPSINNWLKDYQCSENYIQIHRDLNRFVNIDFDKMRNNLIKKYSKPNSVSICNYVLKDNKIFRKCYGQHVDFKIFMDAILLSLTRKVILPDIEFFVNLGDWPLVSSNDVDYPIFSWCGSTDTKDIVMPTYDLTESSLESMGRVMLDMLSVQGNTDTEWKKKIEKLFWRGRDACRERLDLIDISRKYPDLFNVSLTNFFFFKDEIDKYGPPQSRISFFHFFKYKYLLNIDGTVAAYRLPYLLAGDSLVLKQDSKYYEFFYKDLIPEVHFVPVKRDLSNLVDKIEWAKVNDAEALKISKSARQFTRENLLPQHIFCYHAALFHEWSKRLKSNVKILNGMEEVLPLKHSCKCDDTHVGSKDEL